jgi:hypothetical protein
MPIIPPKMIAMRAETFDDLHLPSCFNVGGRFSSRYLTGHIFNAFVLPCEVRLAACIQLMDQRICLLSVGVIVPNVIIMALLLCLHRKWKSLSVKSVLETR